MKSTKPWVALLLLCGCGAPQPVPRTGNPAPAAQAAPAASAPVASAQTIRRIYVVHGRRAGQSVTTIHADGTRETRLEILDNGRGPKVTSRLRLAADGTIASLDATGHDTMGLPVDEHFSVDGQRARWRSTCDRGETDLQGPSFYLPIADDGDTPGLLAEVLASRGGSVRLLPEGQARIERAAETTVRNAAGEAMHLTGYAVTGLWFAPTYVWLDDKGQYFGRGGEWMATVREGWEAAVDSLVEQEQALARSRGELLARKHAIPMPAAGMAITHARVLDVARGRWLADQTVVLSRGEISKVGPANTVRVPAGAATLDASGKWLIPGLWDMHAHVTGGDGEIYIASGITTVRDMGNDPDRIDDMKQRFEDGRAIGPRLLRAGFVEGRGDKASGSKITAETEQEARAAVEEFHRRGYEQLKIYNSIKPELVPILARLAHDKGMRVSGHVPVHMRAEEAVRAGFDELTHLNMVFLNFFIDKDTDTRTTLRFLIPAEKAAGLDLGSPAVRDFVALLKERKTVVDPTVQVFENLFVARPGTISPNVAAIASRLPAAVRRAYLSGGLPVPEGKDQTFRDSFEAMLKLLKHLHDSKVPIVAGTDEFGLLIPHELELYSRAGIANAAVMEIATLGAARVMGRDKSTGSIEVGKAADLVLLDGDPLVEIGNVRKVVTVWRGGTRYVPGPLLADVGIAP